MESRDFGIASSTLQMAGSIGAVFGISVLTTTSSDASSVEVYTAGYLLGAAVAALGVLASLFIRHR